MAITDPTSVDSRSEASLESLRSFETQGDLNRFFRFDLSDYTLKDPESSKGYVSAVEEAGFARAFGHTVLVKEIRVIDPFVQADPEGYARVQEHVTKMEKRIREDGFDPLVERQQKYPYSNESDSPEVREARKRRNPYTEAWLSDPNVAALSAWHKLIPSAVALGHLTEPWLDRAFILEDGTEIPTTPETTAHLRFVDDAIAIRDRAVAMQYIAERHLALTTHPAEKVQWLDIASGTAEPSIKAATKAAKDLGINIELTATDYDANALSFVKGIAEREGFTGKLNIVEGYIIDSSFVDTLPHKQYKIGENAGFEEYMPERDMEDGLGSDEVGAFKDIPLLPNASEFTKWAYDVVSGDTGALISGNMILNRPQSDFVFGVVNWPIINARTEESILRVYKRAGILDDPRAQVEIFRVRDELTNVHIYNIVKVTKVTEDVTSKKIHIPGKALGLSD